uniref:Uncharacterized protein n=1 Tax=Daphnia galeata TaxID=27404 RepID=A0A8J2VYZ2_9CRUS|nr:unnamed protein product [Daphnia galeata]
MSEEKLVVRLPLEPGKCLIESGSSKRTEVLSKEQPSSIENTILTSRSVSSGPTKTSGISAGQSRTDTRSPSPPFSSAHGLSPVETQSPAHQGGSSCTKTQPGCPNQPRNGYLAFRLTTTAEFVVAFLLQRCGGDDWNLSGRANQNAGELSTSQKQLMARIFWIKMSINNIQLNDDEPVTTSELVLPESPIVAFGDPNLKILLLTAKR